MQSAGGVVGIEGAVNNASAIVLSGPAGGVVGAAYVGTLSGYRDLLTFDMGGTSTDVAPIIGGEAQTTTETVIAGVPIRVPMVDVHTVSAGGGSIAWADAGGALRVGPHSAGAEPGPAGYNKGGQEPSPTRICFSDTSRIGRSSAARWCCAANFLRRPSRSWAIRWALTLSRLL